MYKLVGARYNKNVRENINRPPNHKEKTMKAKTPARRTLIENALAVTNCDGDKITHHKDGTVTVRWSYFYQMGRGPEKYGDRITKALPGVRIIEATDEFAQWPKTSYMAVRIDVAGVDLPSFLPAKTTAEDLPEGPVVPGEDAIEFPVIIPDESPAPDPVEELTATLLPEPTVPAAKVGRKKNEHRCINCNYGWTRQDIPFCTYKCAGKWLAKQGIKLAPDLVPGTKAYNSHVAEAVTNELAAA